MAKNPMEKPKLKVIQTHKRFRNPSIAKCGCGKQPEYALYEHEEPHCRECMLDAVDCSVFVMVKRYDGGYDDAS